MQNRNLKRRNQRPRVATEFPAYQLIETDDGSRTLYSIDDQETFHSESGAAAESSLVFVDNSQLTELPARHLDQNTFRVLEIGFGTGLNFFLTCDRWLNSEFTSATGLEYVAVESRILPPALIAGLDYQHLIEHPALLNDWLNWYSGGFGEASIKFSRPWTFNNVSLDLQPIDAAGWDYQVSSKFDAIFLDAFSPATNPALWSEEFLSRLYGVLGTNRRLVTYCVKSSIQASLRNLGFEVHTTTGPVNGKREVLVATKR